MALAVTFPDARRLRSANTSGGGPGLRGICGAEKEKPRRGGVSGPVGKAGEFCGGGRATERSVGAYVSGLTGGSTGDFRARWRARLGFFTRSGSAVNPGGASFCSMQLKQSSDHPSSPRRPQPPQVLESPNRWFQPARGLRCRYAGPRDLHRLHSIQLPPGPCCREIRPNPQNGQSCASGLEDAGSGEPQAQSVDGFGNSGVSSLMIHQCVYGQNFHAETLGAGHVLNG